MRTAGSPLVSHPPLHLPLTHVRHLSHPRFHFRSSISSLLLSVLLRCHTPVAFWPTPPPQPSSSIPLHHHSAPPVFILSSLLASESHGSWIIHTCSPPGNFAVFWPVQKPLYVHHRWPTCCYKTPTKARLGVCDCCLWVYLNVSSPHAAYVRKPTCTFALKSNKMGGERKRRHALLAQGYMATIPTHFPSSRGSVYGMLSSRDEEIVLILEPSSLWWPISTSAINLSI